MPGTYRRTSTAAGWGGVGSAPRSARGVDCRLCRGIADKLDTRFSGAVRSSACLKPAAHPPDEADLLDGIRHARVIFGHTHLPFRRVSDVRGIELVNPGSVGMPFDGDTRAAYALVHRDHTVEHRRVEYDVSATLERLRSLGEPWTETVARRVEQARMDV